MRKMRIGWVTVILIFSTFFAQAASAHEMPSSAVSLEFQEKTVTAELILPLDRLEIAFGESLTEAPADVLKKYESELATYILQHVQPVSPDGEAWLVKVAEMSLQLAEQPYDLIVRLDMEPPASAPLDHFIFNYDVILHEIFTHSILVSVNSDWNHAVTASEPVLLGTLRADVTSLEVDRSGGSWWTGFTNIVGQGIAHIAEGTDHLLFLLVLLLPAPLLERNRRWLAFGGIRHSLLQLLKVVTAFTIGHSLTLAQTALGLIPGTSKWIEALIALSILVSAIHAQRPLFPGREALVAFGFGLVHGMAFASLIADIGITPWRMVSSIFGFNAGIELMQLAVVAVTMPWLLILSVTRWYPAVRIAGSLLAMVAAAAWIVERVTETANPMANIVNAAAPYAGWLIVILALAAILALIWTKAGGKAGRLWSDFHHQRL